MPDEVKEDLTPDKKKQETDAGSDSYVIAYKTMEHSTGENSSQVGFDYGSSMNSSAEQLTKGSFSGKGDNLQWASLYWKFTIDGEPVIFKADLNSPGRSAATTNLLVPTGGAINTSEGIISLNDLKSFPSYPFSQDGSVRSSEELSRDSKGRAFAAKVTGPKSNGLPDTTRQQAIVNSLLHDTIRATGPDGIQKLSDFDKVNNLRYLNSNNLLAHPNGLADEASTETVKKILRSAPAKELKAPQKSVFAPGAKESEPEEQSRFADGFGSGASKGEDATPSIDKKKVNEVAKHLDTINTKAQNLGKTFKSLGLTNKSSSLNRMTLAAIRLRQDSLDKDEEK